MLVTSKGTNYLHNLPTSITTGDAQKQKFGFALDCNLSINEHVSIIA